MKFRTDVPWWAGCFPSTMLVFDFFSLLFSLSRTPVNFLDWAFKFLVFFLSNFLYLCVFALVFYKISSILSNILNILVDFHFCHYVCIYIYIYNESSFVLCSFSNASLFILQGCIAFYLFEYIDRGFEVIFSLHHLFSPGCCCCCFYLLTLLSYS